MSCDIHSVAQVQSADGSWQTLVASVAGDNRDYSVFGAFAGVRREPEGGEKYPPRGLPDDFEGSIERQRPGNSVGAIHSIVVSASVRMAPGYVEESDYRFAEDHRMWLGEHSFSWLTLREVKEIAASYAPVSHGYATDDGVQKYLDSLEALAKREGITDETKVRLVFGFDS